MSHVECTRPRTLTTDERHLLFVYCWNHIVAQCLPCSLGFRIAELGADPFGGRMNMPRCRKDLTENVRTHLYGCAKLPSEVRLRAQALRDAARRLVRQSQELVDNADIVFDSKNPFEAKAKAQMLASLLADKLPSGFVEKVTAIDPSVYGQRGDVEPKKELIKLLADKPQQRKQIIRDWTAAFPRDEWANRLGSGSP